MRFLHPEIDHDAGDDHQHASKLKRCVNGRCLHYERDHDRTDAIVDAADEFDVVVMGESDPSLTTFVFGLPADQVADRFLGPVLVVQREPPQVTGE